VVEQALRSVRLEHDPLRCAWVLEHSFTMALLSTALVMFLQTGLTLLGKLVLKPCVFSLQSTDFVFEVEDHFDARDLESGVCESSDFCELCEIVLGVETIAARCASWFDQSFAFVVP